MRRLDSLEFLSAAAHAQVRPSSLEILDHRYTSLYTSKNRTPSRNFYLGFLVLFLVWLYGRFWMVLDEIGRRYGNSLFIFHSIFHKPGPRAAENPGTKKPIGR